MATIFDLEQDIIALQAQVSSLIANVSALQSADASTDDELIRVKARLANLETCCEGTDDTIAALQTSTTNMSNSLTALQATVASVQSTIAAIPNDVDALKTDMSTAKTDVTALKSSVSGLQSSIGGMQSTLAAVQTAQNNTNGEISAIETKISGIETKYAAQQVEINALKAQDVSTTTRIATAENAIKKLQEGPADSGWINLPLASGWSQTQYESEVPQYRKIGKRVVLRGLVSATAAAGTTIATLPAGYRPSRDRYNRFACSLAQSDQVNVQIGRDGVIQDYNKTTSISRSFVSLHGISFVVD